MQSVISESNTIILGQRPQGGHGGRVYSTALSVMTLEVYYRYLPMHIGGETRVARETNRLRLQ